MSPTKLCFSNAEIWQHPFPLSFSEIVFLAGAVTEELLGKCNYSSPLSEFVSVESLVKNILASYEVKNIKNSLKKSITMLQLSLHYKLMT